MSVITWMTTWICMAWDTLPATRRGDPWHQMDQAYALRGILWGEAGKTFPKRPCQENVTSFYVPKRLFPNSWCPGQRVRQWHVEKIARIYITEGGREVLYTLQSEGGPMKRPTATTRTVEGSLISGLGFSLMQIGNLGWLSCKKLTAPGVRIKLTYQRLLWFLHQM